MWFKNLSLFRLTEPFAFSADELNERLQAGQFRSCGNLDFMSYGWTTPVGQDESALVYSLNNNLMVCAKKEEKILPAGVINEIVQQRIEEAEERKGGGLSKRERTQLRDDVVHELLPKAFTHSRRTFAYIDVKGGWLLVDSASGKKAEELVSHLRKCLGSLPVILPSTRERPASVMTQWLVNGAIPSGFAFDSECELRSTEAEGGIVRCKRQDLTAPEVQNHIEAGKEVVKMALTWDERIGFLLNDDLSVKRLKFLDVVQDQAAEVEAADEIERFDVDFAILALELSNFVPKLMQLFGGENDQGKS
jgi:recombination associated protein RdgC